MTKNERTVRKCGRCGCLLSRYREGTNCSPCQESMRRLEGMEQRLREFALSYGYGGPEGEEGSLRRFGEHVRGVRDPLVLGVTYDANQGVMFHSSPGEMRGPVADAPTRYLLRSGMEGIDLEICPGAISGRCYVHRVRTDLKHPWVQLSTERGYSGAVYKIVAKHA